MTTRLPPRREPRALALVRSPTGFSYAVADPWELRAVGTVPCRALSLGPAVARLLRREKPTLVVAGKAELEGPVLRAAGRLRIPVTEASLPSLPRAIAADLFPELPMRAPTPSLAAVATLAIAAVLYAEAPPRTYAHRRHRSVRHAA